MKHFLLSVLFLGIFIGSGFSQSTIKGKVTGETDTLGLPGVTVVVEGKPTLGTVTDVNGDYSLKVPNDAENLKFSYVSMETQIIPIKGRKRINVVMRPSSTALEGVMVTAIGIKEEKKSLGYAAQEVSGDLVKESREPNLVNALSSKVAGLDVVSTSGTPGASANITIRGRSSLTGNNSPLFVVDGVPIDNSFAGSNFTDQSNRAIDLNSSDIKSISVLKGPAASALYGIRAANGAIIITTKDGTADGKQYSSKVTFESHTSFDVVNKLPERQKTYAQGYYNSQGMPVYSGPGTGTNTSWGPALTDLRYDGNENYKWSSLGQIVSKDDPAAGSKLVKPFDNVDNFFQTGFKQNTHVSVSGAQNRTNYYFSVGNLYHKGVVPNSDFKRTSLKLSGGTKLTDKLRVSASANYTHSGGNRMQRGSNLSGIMLGLMRTPPEFDLSNGTDDPVNNPDAYMFDDGTPRNYYSTYDNPYWTVNKNLSQDRVNRIIGQTQANYEILPWLNAIYRLGLDYYFEERKSYWDEYSGEFADYGGFIIDDQYSFQSINSDFLLTAQKEIFKDLDLTATVGHNFLNERTYNVMSEGKGFVLPNYYDISNTNAVETDDYIGRYRIVGAYYNVKFGYKDYLYLSTTGRNDWTSTLPAGSNSFFYPSVNIGFVFTEPLDLSTNKYFSYGKLRASWAEVGNDAPRYSLRNYFGKVENIQGQLSYLPLSTIGNINLLPEKTRSTEVGMDLRFFNNRLGIDFTWYRSISDGQILAVPISTSTGYVESLANAGKIENKGIELQLHGKIIERKDMEYNIMLNFTANENTVLELAEGVPDISFPGYGVASTSSRAIEGEPFGVIYGTRWMRNNDGDILIDDNGYPIMDTVSGIVGDPNPDFTLGFNNTFKYKNFRISALIDIRQGGDMYNGTLGVMQNLGIHKTTEDREEEVVIEGVRASDGKPNTTPITKDQNYYAKYPFAGVSEAVIEDASWIRLRTVNVSWSLPKKWFKNSAFEGVEVGLLFNNLLLITNYSGIDPETNLSGASNSIGRDYFNTPNTKSYGFNISASL